MLLLAGISIRCCLSYTTWAQTQSNVNGLVTDFSGEPLIGVSILVKGTSSYTAAMVGRDLRGILFERIQNQSMKNALKRPTGEQIKRIANDTEKVQDFVSYHGKEAVVRVFSVSVILAVMFWMNWKLTCWIVLPIIAGFFFSRFIFKRMNHPFRINWKLFSKMESVLYDKMCIRDSFAFFMGKKNLCATSRDAREKMKSCTKCLTTAPFPWKKSKTFR